MAHNINQKKAHGGRVKGFGPADGNGPNTGAPGPTPAPTKKVAPDVISAPRNATPEGYGMSPGHNPSSIAPGEQLLSPMAEVLKEASDDGEGALDRVIGEGTARRDNAISDQLRDIAPGNVPDAHGMKRQNDMNALKGASLPTKNGATAAADDSGARRATRA
jgi:hypothetical protein